MNYNPSYINIDVDDENYGLELIRGDWQSFDDLSDELILPEIDEEFFVDSLNTVKSQRIDRVA